MKALVASLLAAIFLAVSPSRADAPAAGAYVIFADRVVEDMQAFLWPDADFSILHGPEDAIYICPLESEIPDLLAFWRKYRQGLSYFNEAWDCDDYAREFLHLARAWGRRHYVGFPAATLVGAAYVRIDGWYELFGDGGYAEGYHVLNVIRRADGKWFFLEPQNGRMVPVEGMIYEGAVEVLKVQI